ncbi:MAG: nucleotidyltransferase family protein [Rhizobiaceae bacterium]|nr:nucleotidyltransferase family protein [Rhizobiaceae bacterium]MCV0408659.1 nucleotidyltransferase family protein [Rhizobiaceae bacterium]
MRPSEALALHRDEVLAILSRYPVRNPRVFGSVARGEDTEDSDLDILVERSERLTYIDLARLEIDLEKLLGVDVGVHTAAEFRPAVARLIEGEFRAL